MARSNTGNVANWLQVDSCAITGTDNKPHTISCWFYPANLTSTMNLVAIGNPAAPSGEYAVLLFDGANAYGNGDNLIIFDNTGGVEATSTAGPGAANVWYHAAGVFAAANSRAVYFNGANKGTNATSLTLDSSGFNRTWIGVYRPDTTSFSPLNGRIANVGIWDVVLTDAEIAALGKRASPLLVRPASLVFYAPIFGRTSPEPDFSGARNLTVNGTMAQAEHAPMVYPSRPLWHMGAPPAPPPWPPPSDFVQPELYVVQGTQQW